MASHTWYPFFYFHFEESVGVEAPTDRGGATHMVRLGGCPTSPLGGCPTPVVPCGISAREIETLFEVVDHGSDKHVFVVGHGEEGFMYCTIRRSPHTYAQLSIFMCLLLERVAKRSKVHQSNIAATFMKIDNWVRR